MAQYQTLFRWLDPSWEIQNVKQHQAKLAMNILRHTLHLNQWVEVKLKKEDGNPNQKRKRQNADAALKERQGDIIIKINIFYKIE